jgi:hypothetical protein
LIKEGLDQNLRKRRDGDFSALLYHPQRPCANPAAGVMMNKQQAIGVRAESWLID